MSIINNGLLLASGADAATTYQISRSIRLNAPDSAYFSRTPSSAGNRTIYTWSFWIKRWGLGEYHVFRATSDASNYTEVYFGSNDKLNFQNVVSGTQNTRLVTTQVFRDTSAWYHFVIAINGSTSAKIYVNGTEITAYDTTVGPGSSNHQVNNTVSHTLGSGASTGYANIYLADVYLLDGTATTPSTFAETDAVTGQWVPKTPTGISYGTNGFRLSFSDNSGTTSTTLGKDAAGSNNWTPNNFSVASGSGNDSLVDSPTSYGTDTGAGSEVRGNYCVLNPLDSGGGTLSNGNLEHTYSSSNTRVRSTISIPETGKWYAEFVASNTGGGNSLVGVSTGTNALTGTNWYLGSDADSWGCQIGSGTMYTYHAGGYSSFGTAASGDVISVAVDRAAGKIWWAVNNTWIGSGNPATGANARYTDIPATGALFFAISNQNSSSIVCNFGQRAFAYTAPSGFKALCDTNLTAPTIALPNTVMDVVLYSGTGSNQTITGLNFNPDFVWLKRRSSAQAHYLYDVIRGTSSVLYSDGADAEQSISTGLTAFNSNGFSLGSLSGVNASSTTNVAWAWDAGTSTVTNNNGSISSQVRANASAGFSIVTYTGTGSLATVGHGLGAAPSFIIVKARSTTYNWSCYHISTGKDYVLNLNTTGAGGSGANSWGTAAPTSTVFGVKDAGPENNGSGVNFVAYCFAPVAGYSSFGSYTGNGSSQFVYLGFRPKFWMHKRTDSTGSWMMVDAVRSSYNVAQDQLYANLSNADSQYGGSGILDFVSNGVVLRSTGSDVNGSSVPYIYIAFAENPFAYARAR